MDMAPERQGRSSGQGKDPARAGPGLSPDRCRARGLQEFYLALVRDLPRPPRLSYEECRKRSAEGVRRYWAVEGPLREAERAAVSAAAAAQIGELTDREILIAGAIAYWCEGGKSKPHNPHDRVSFVNSDATLIKFFLRFLGVAGVGPERLIFRVYIHESADVEAAQRFWLDTTQADPAQFRRPTLKRHNPRTVRKNTAESYHGCLRIDVLRGAQLYRQIEGWVRAVVLAEVPCDLLGTGQDPNPT
jgi:hypothetical protein